MLCEFLNVCLLTFLIFNRRVAHHDRTTFTFRNENRQKKKDGKKRKKKKQPKQRCTIDVYIYTYIYLSYVCTYVFVLNFGSSRRVTRTLLTIHAYKLVGTCAVS